ncbi:hypothetical protein H6F76_22685 [Leptolyngbya sp. FACHB-321]|uniref:hypothetical protein n=1 Tax=Leptolyngbya sp. FACHB-321 TaxID=2692807 RepID=UPI0016877BBD|nr:hypothetical protein [Leptolyngbya sp. FACHB-321]MBD2037765.1 hypothetical protein [Leptolyngbya sp. FACHB-321]
MDVNQAKVIKDYLTSHRPNASKLHLPKHPRFSEIVIAQTPPQMWDIIGFSIEKLTPKDGLPLLFAGHWVF